MRPPRTGSPSEAAGVKDENSWSAADNEAAVVGGLLEQGGPSFDYSEAGASPGAFPMLSSRSLQFDSEAMASITWDSVAPGDYSRNSESSSGSNDGGHDVDYSGPATDPGAAFGSQMSPRVASSSGRDNSTKPAKAKRQRGKHESELAERGEGPPLRRACNFCTRRRRKCDGVQPVCGTCTNRKGDCIYDVNRKKLVRDSPWHTMIRDGTALTARKVLEEAKNHGDEVDIVELASTLATDAVAPAPSSNSRRRAPRKQPPAQSPVPKMVPEPSDPAPVDFGGFNLPTTTSSFGLNSRSEDELRIPRVVSGPLFPPLLPPFASVPSIVSSSTHSQSSSNNFLGTSQSFGRMSAASPGGADSANVPPTTQPESAAQQVTPNVNALLEYVQQVLQVQQQQRQEVAFQELQREVSTEEGLKQAFIRDVVPSMPRYIKHLLFADLPAHSEFADYCPDISGPPGPYPGPHTLLPLLTACKRLIIRHITLPMFLPSLVHIILFSTVLCAMAVDPNGDQGPVDASGDPGGSDWTPLAWPHTAKEVDAVLRICVGMSKRMGMNKEPIGRANVDEQTVGKNARESKIIESEVVLEDGVLFMDGAGASVDPGRQDMTRRLWWLQYVTDRELCCLVFRRPVIDDKDCFIHPAHLAKELIDVHNSLRGGSESSMHELGSLEANEFQDIASDSMLRSFSLLGRVVNYRISCHAFRLDPNSQDDPLRQELLWDLDHFRKAVPKIAGAYDKNHSTRDTTEYRELIGSLDRIAVRKFAIALMAHRGCGLLLNAPPDSSEAGSEEAWSTSPAHGLYADAAFGVVNIITNMLWTDIFGFERNSPSFVGFKQVIAFQAAMTLAGLLQGLQVSCCCCLVLTFFKARC